MTDDDLLAQTAALRAEADRLLHGDGLLGAIAAGPAAAIGSNALDLMTWPDLDVSLELPDEQDVAAFFDVGRAVARSFVAMWPTPRRWRGSASSSWPIVSGGGRSATTRALATEMNTTGRLG